MLSAKLSQTWEEYDKGKPQGYYKTVHNDRGTDDLILQVVGKEDTYADTTDYKYLRDKLTVHFSESGLFEASQIIPGRDGQCRCGRMGRILQPRVSRLYRLRCFGGVPRSKGVKVLGSIMRNEYKTTDGVLDKRKTRWCV